MSAASVMARAERAGVRLAAVDGRLTFQAPRGALTPELRTALRQYKEEVLALLTASSDPASVWTPETGLPIELDVGDPYAWVAVWDDNKGRWKHVRDPKIRVRRRP